MAQTREVRGVSTTIMTKDGQTEVIYHGTPVVTFDGHSVTLQARGWLTATTKLRMNQAARQFGLRFAVFQKDFDWYVGRPDGEVVPYREGISFNY